MRQLFLVVAAVVLVYYSAVAQVADNDLQISISTISRFNIDIYKQGSDVKIVYSLLDSVRQSALEKDEFYKKFMKGQGLKDSIATENMLAAFKKYEVYSRDSLQFRADSDPSYLNLLNLIANSTEAQLVPQNRIMLDGINITISILQKAKKVKFRVHSPDKDSDPEIYQLITRSLDLYREKRNNNFLDKRRTFNY